MTTLQAFFGHSAGREDKAGDKGRLRAAACTALGITLLGALLAAGLAIRVLVYVHF